MPSTYSPSLKLELIGNGEQAGVWGTTTNTNLGTLLEQAITGVLPITLTGGDVTLTDYNGLPDQARNAVLIFNGLLGAPCNVIAPPSQKVYIIRNRSNATVTIKTASGNGISISNAASEVIFCDGTDFYGATQFNYIDGNLFVTGNATIGKNITFGNNLYGNGSTDQVFLPIGTEGQRASSPSNGLIRYNTTNQFYEGYQNNVWIKFVTVPQGAYTISYLTVAGAGGGAGSGGGGGGAGGYLFGTTAAGAGITFTCVVGAGGAASSVGTNTSLTTQTATISSTSGGGAGGSGNGGSGGGGNGIIGFAPIPGGSGTTAQGFAGGSGGFNSGSPAYYVGPGGGGGGASAVGAAVGGGGPVNGGAGGSGAQWAVNSTYYAGGGGGGGDASPTSGGGGGNGGGGAGGTGGQQSNPGFAGTPGTANLGGGGGGGGSSIGTGGNGGNGGKGVIILVVPTNNYTGITTGSPTISTLGSNTLLTFTTSGSYSS
jgi:hypothetical protein